MAHARLAVEAYKVTFDSCLYITRTLGEGVDLSGTGAEDAEAELKRLRLISPSVSVLGAGFVASLFCE